jgi:hypothetical protein
LSFDMDSRSAARLHPCAVHASRITHHGASASNYRSPECQQLAFSTIGINVAQE